MSYIHFKSVVNKNFDKVTFDGSSISLTQLKKLIAEKSKFSKQVDFDLEISNADTSQVYQNENETILKNTRVVVKRIVKNSSAPLRAKEHPKIINPPVITTTQSQQSKQLQQQSLHQSLNNLDNIKTTISHSIINTSIESSLSNMNSVKANTLTTNNSYLSNTNISYSENTKTTITTATNITNESNLAPISQSAYDSLAPLNIPSKPIVYVDDSSAVSHLSDNKIGSDSSSDSRLDEKAKLECILMTSMTKASTNDLINPTIGSQQNRFPVPNPIGNKSWPRMPHLMVNRPIPPNYVCVICKKPGHFKQLCPEAGTMRRPEERPKFPSGIPRTNLRPAQPGDKFVMLGPEGYVVTEIEHKASQIIKKDKPVFQDDDEKENDDLKANQQKDQLSTSSSGSSSNYQIPADLKCPFGDHIIKDAVLIPCCGHFVCCDECIKQKISNDENIECPYEKCDQEIGSLISITPFHETRKKVNDYLNEVKNSKTNIISKSPGQTQQTSTDSILDLILNEVNDKSSLTDNLLINKHSVSQTTKSSLSNLDASPTTNTGSESPLQDSKISSSEIASQQQQSILVNSITSTNKSIDLALNSMNESLPLSQQPQQLQPALLPNPQQLELNNQMVQSSHITNRGPYNNIQMLGVNTPLAIPVSQNDSQYMNNNRMHQNYFHLINPTYQIRQRNPNFRTNIVPLTNNGSTTTTAPSSNSRPNIIVPVQRQHQHQTSAPQTLTQSQLPLMLPPFNPNMAYMNRNQYQIKMYTGINAHHLQSSSDLIGPPQSIAHRSQKGTISNILTNPNPFHHTQSKFPSIPPNQVSLMSKAEFYDYQEKLRKKAENQDLEENNSNNQQSKSNSRRSRNRSRTRTRSHSRERSRSYKRSRSRSITRSRSHSRSRYSRSRSNLSRQRREDNERRSNKRHDNKKSNRRRSSRSRSRTRSTETRSRSRSRNRNKSSSKYSIISKLEANRYCSSSSTKISKTNDYNSKSNDKHLKSRKKKSSKKKSSKKKLQKKKYRT